VSDPNAGGASAKPPREKLCYGLAACAGMLTWLVPVLVSGDDDAFDTPLYLVAYGLLAVVCGVCGWLVPTRVWRWAVSAQAFQAIPALLVGKGDAGLWPLTLMLFGVLSLPLLVTATLGARIARRGEARRTA
jgi:hypothetical protein